MAYTFDDSGLRKIKEQAIESMNTLVQESSQVYTGLWPVTATYEGVSPVGLILPTLADGAGIVEQVLTEPQFTALPDFDIGGLQGYNETDINKLLAAFNIPVPDLSGEATGETTAIWEQSVLFSDTSFMPLLRKNLADVLTWMTATWAGDVRQKAASRRNQIFTDINSVVVSRQGALPHVRLAQLDALRMNSVDDTASQEDELLILLTEQAAGFSTFAMRTGISIEGALAGFTTSYNSMRLQAEELAVAIYRARVEAEVARFKLFWQQQLARLENYRQQVELIALDNSGKVDVQQADMEQKGTANKQIDLYLEGLKLAGGEKAIIAAQYAQAVEEAKIKSTVSLQEAERVMTVYLNKMTDTINSLAATSKQAAQSIKQTSTAAALNVKKRPAAA